MQDKDLEPKSKSQKKREHLALQDLAEALSRLSPRELDEVPMSEDLRGAVEEAGALKKGALRRHFRYLAKRIDEENPRAIQEALARLKHGSREETARLHRIERWREQLIAGDAGSLSAFLDAYPHTNRQKLRQLIRASRQEREQGAPPRAFRQLFSLIREQEP